VSPSIASITFDSTDPEPLARWWAERFGAEIIANMDGFFLLVAGGSLPTQLAFQRVDDPTPGKNKVHLDVHTDGRRLGRCRRDEPREAQRR
jgi:Glyoxalase-like domain